MIRLDVDLAEGGDVAPEILHHTSSEVTLYFSFKRALREIWLKMFTLSAEAAEWKSLWEADTLWIQVHFDLVPEDGTSDWTEIT